MPYNLHIFAPNDLLAGPYQVVVENCTIPLEDMLSSPPFKIYPGLCVIAMNDSLIETLYTCVFGKSGCVDVSGRSARMNRLVRHIDHNNLFTFWRCTNNSDIMASMISELLDLKTLRQLSDKIIESMKGEIRPHYFEFLTSASWLSNEEFEDRIVAIQSLRKSTYDYRESAYLATTILICVSRLVRGDKNIFQSICFEYQRYLAVRLRSSMPTVSFSVAKLLREWVPFHQIVDGLL